MISREVDTDISIVLFIFGILWILLWLGKNKERESGAYLNITMNSGISFLILFRDRYFLSTVLNVLQTIIIEVGNRNVSINIINSDIKGDLDILNNSSIE